MDVSAAKILVVLVVALMVLGPDRLPQAARQAGRYANEFRRFRDGLHAEVRGTFGDPAELSSLPGKGQAWIDSVTAEVLLATSTGPSETSPPLGGPTPGDASSQAPSGSGPVLEAGRPGPVTGTAPDDPEASSRLNRGFN